MDLIFISRVRQDFFVAVRDASQVGLVLQEIGDACQVGLVLQDLRDAGQVDYRTILATISLSSVRKAAAS